MITVFVVGGILIAYSMIGGVVYGITSTRYTNTRYSGDSAVASALAWPVMVPWLATAALTRKVQLSLENRAQAKRLARKAAEEKPESPQLPPIEEPTHFCDWCHSQLKQGPHR